LSLDARAKIPTFRLRFLFGFHLLAPGSLSAEVVVDAASVNSDAGSIGNASVSKGG